MTSRKLWFFAAALAVNLTSRACTGEDVYPAAILTFQERGDGVKGYGAKISELLFAALASKRDLLLVDRTELDKKLQEQEINLSGGVDGDKAIQVGRLSGAKILVAGSAVDLNGKLYLIAKVIGAETAHVVGTSVQGKTGDKLAPLVERLAEQVAAAIKRHSGQLVASKAKTEDRRAAIKEKLQSAAKKPKLWVHLAVRHIRRGDRLVTESVDSAAEMEFTSYAKEAGFEVIDPDWGNRKHADIIVEGEEFIELAARRGGLFSVKARVEIKAVDRRSGKLLAIDEQVEIGIDRGEQMADEGALKDAAAVVAERMLPMLVNVKRAEN